MQVILLLGASSNPSEFPLILPAHLDLIPRTLSSLPEATDTLLPHQASMTDATILRSIILLSRAPSTNHAVGPLIGMVLCFIVAFIACIHFRAAAEAEPAVALGVMSAAASFGEFGAGC